MNCPYCKGAGKINISALAGKMLAYRARAGLGTRAAAKTAGIPWSNWNRAERGLTVLPRNVKKIQAAIKTAVTRRS